MTNNTAVIATATTCLLQISPYALRHRDIVQDLLQQGESLTALTAADYQRLVAAIAFEQSASLFAKALRHFRHYHLLRLSLRELSGLADTTETMLAWSDCADALITHTLQYCHRQLAEQHGIPCHLTGEPAECYVLAMGKLGGQELNFSSDIDLIFCYSAVGNTNGTSSISNQQFYTKIVQQFVQLLQQSTAEGFVFRVDLRLRPNGDSGPLVFSLAAMEIYYQEQGRDWERYAMVKARVIGASIEPSWFQRLITPFVYRRYVDYNVIESLRSMKAMIMREVQLNPGLDDIKRGQGGIREIEFIIQSFQLIRGGRLSAIRQQNAIQALTALTQQGLLTKTARLKKAYLFLRKLENMIQLHNDQQLHTLPTESLTQLQLTQAMSFSSWAELLAALQRHQRVVSQTFTAILNQAMGYEDNSKALSNQLLNIWQGHVEPHLAITMLSSLGYEQAERCYQLIQGFRHGPRCRRLSQAVRLRVDRFMALLLQELTRFKATDAVLLLVIQLLENIVGRSAYMALLCENLSVLQELLYWFAHSPFISSLLINQPFLLEVLIDQTQSWQPPSSRQLKVMLHNRLRESTEMEAQDEILRQFKLTCWLLAARAELYGQCDAVRIAAFLADVATVIITEVFTRACQQLSKRYSQMRRIKSQFAIVAYGKLGSGEMNYDSDVDLVFLHQVQPADEPLVIRLSQKILYMLTTRLQAGVLYAVDTRLRPSGSAGLLVSHIDTFAHYQLTQAWTWEHQALLRARILCAQPLLKKQLMHLKQQVLQLPRNTEQLRQDIQTMRGKINQHAAFNAIKHPAGGLLDLEFLVQFLILRSAEVTFARLTHTLRQVNRLSRIGALTRQQRHVLTLAYREYHCLLHQHLLQPETEITANSQSAVLQLVQFFKL